jgi:hypothetical protein
MLVEDTTKDPRFKNSPFVQNDPPHSFLCGNALANHSRP